MPAWERFPTGDFTAVFERRTWHGSRAIQIGGRSEKLVAQEAGGSGYVSANLYRLSGGRIRVFPCEMPIERVRAFVTGARVTGD